MAVQPARFELDLDRIRFVGSGLCRPECVLATRAGTLYASDRRGGVMRIHAASGNQTGIGCAGSGADAAFLPNGIALLRDGSLLVANLGTEGGIWRLFADGRREPWVTVVAGVPLPGVNFVWLDALERVWFTVMFRSQPVEFATDGGYGADGWLGLVDGVDRPRTARVVGEGITSANECRISADGRFLYVNETFAHRLCRFPLARDGTLGARAVVAQFDEDTLPDGLTLDAEGGLWITGFAANRIIRVQPDHSWHVVVEDLAPAHMAQVRAVVRAGTLDRDVLYDNHARVLPNITSLAFGGPDLRTAYLGSLSGERIAVFDSPVAGAKPTHWDW